MQAGDDTDDRQTATRAVGKPGRGSQPGKMRVWGWGGSQTDGQRRGVEKTGGQMGGEVPGKGRTGLGLGVGAERTDRQQGIVAPCGGEDRQRTCRESADRWTRCRRGPRGRGQAEGARGGGQSGEAEAGRAAVFVELSAAVEL